MPTRDDVCVLIPTYNEAAAIGDVIDGFHDQDLQKVLVIDGGSADDTQEIAAEHGAEVVEQSGSGKGQAVREAFEYIDAPYILMVDGDGTYRPADADVLLDPLLSGEADHVIGNRFADMESGAMTRLNQVGNRLINRAFARIHGRDFVDILSGYRAMTRESIDRFDLSSEGFGIETELSVECVKHNVTTEVVPIRYESRPEDTETNLRPFRDGAVILLTLYRMAKTNNPLFYFGSVGTASLLVGALLGVYVAVEWFMKNISHEVIAIVSAVGIIFGVQLLVFGVLSDMIFKLHREQMHRLDQVLEDTRSVDEETSE
ncbi:S-layer glycoprotein N-glycosyltransferase AglJ [Halorhabdus sp. BNX81]|uniref:S-layer glycoprotein N-glycosyltransferase AglJ n=1 Tax=Halorhabdus sp. BNX81 TaxID=2980181 RepID=UPI0023DD175D|nr:S-layer glycoprotein N-glycosyltransferase AglJ [Halorhabdus sp. BNX81]